MFRIISHILLNTSGQGKKEIASLIKKSPNQREVVAECISLIYK